MRSGLIVAVLLLGAAAGALLGVRHWLDAQYAAAGPAQQPTRVVVAPGSGVRAVLGQLSAAGVLAHPRRTELDLRLHRRRFNPKAGEYEIPAHASAATIVTMLVEGRVVLQALTIVEGTTFADFRHALENDPKVHATLRGKSDAEVMAAIGHPGEQPEGRFFPDTYRFAAGTTDAEILKQAYERMQQVLTDAWARHADVAPLSTAYDALVLASIVEKETGLPTERPRIAGVFLSRLRKGMRLQSDPTVIYGMGAQYAGEIRTRDLLTDTPYNTYTRAGLPPTPIALPGREAIQATVHPAANGELYFVATGDGDGGHHFSATLAEHNVAVQHYLQRLRAQGAIALPSTATTRSARSGR
ncbi:MAG TPA: endolytic transglycosylase MltG [Steroidobacteraceae bacterium]|nr:endolytic transglycosylase MltG [Steroidobacteraceae bacterium]